MPAELIGKLLEDMADHAEAVHTVIPLLHGEPLLYPGLYTLLEDITQAVGTHKTELVTNASLLDPAASEMLVLALEMGRLRKIVFSCDGLESFELVRVGLSQDKVYGNILDFVGLLSEDMRTRIRVDMTVCKTNKGDLEEFAKFWDNLGITWNFAPCDGRFNRGESLSHPSPLPCRVLWESVYIHSDGGFVKCCVDWRGTAAVGDLNRQTVSEVWNGEVYGMVRNYHIRLQKNLLRVCETCDTSM